MIWIIHKFFNENICCNLVNVSLKKLEFHICYTRLSTTERLMITVIACNGSNSYFTGACLFSDAFKWSLSASSELELICSFALKSLVVRVDDRSTYLFLLRHWTLSHTVTLLASLYTCDPRILMVPLTLGSGVKNLCRDHCLGWGMRAVGMIHMVLCHTLLYYSVLLHDVQLILARSKGHHAVKLSIGDHAMNLLNLEYSHNYALSV